MTREDLLQFARRYAMQTVAALNDDNCIPADDKGPRPDLPYLVLKVTSHDDPHVIRDEVINSIAGGGEPQEKIRGDRRAVLSATGFGEASEAWLRDMGLKIGLESTQIFLRGESVRVRILTEILDTSVERDTGIEPQFTRDFVLSYFVETGDEPLVEFTEGQIDVTFESREGDPDPLVDTITTE